MIGGQISIAWWTRALSLLAAFMLVASPIAASAFAAGDCCADAPCRDGTSHKDGKPMCPDICVVACRALPAPSVQIGEPTTLPAPKPTPGVFPCRSAGLYVPKDLHRG